MKFTGLILICATSCLALILPAVGVVQFPKASEPLYADTRLASSQGWPVSTQSGMGSSPNNLSWTPSMPPGPTSHPPLTSQAPLVADRQFDDRVPQLDGTANSGGTLGMGIWFMLVSVCLIGLAMWTFAPNPSGAKSRSA